MTEKEIQASNVGLRDYAAGVAVANGPAWLLNTYRDIIAAQLPLILHTLILSLAILGGSAVSGYLIARKTGEIYQRAGITTGLLSFLLYFVLSFFLGLEAMPLESSITLTCFVVGAAAGAKYYDIRRYSKKELKKVNRA